MEHPDSIEVRVQALFPDQVEEVWALLDEHIGGIDNAEHEPVLHAVLSLSGSDRARLDRLLKVASRDYREVLVMASEAEEQSQ